MYQSVIIVPPSASVEINGAIDNIFKVARHKKPLTLVPLSSLSFGFKISDKTIPFSESLDKIPGFFDIERSDFAYLLEINDLKDVYREKNPLKKKSSFWNKDLTTRRKHDNGWRLDYFLTSEKILDKIVNYDFLIDMKGSSHCPITIEIE